LAFKITGLMAVGLTLIMVGIAWMVFDGILDNMIIPKYWVSGNVFLDVMLIEFNTLPIIILFIGIVVMILDGASQRGYSA